MYRCTAGRTVTSCRLPPRRCVTPGPRVWVFLVLEGRVWDRCPARVRPRPLLVADAECAARPGLVLAVRRDGRESLRRAAPSRCPRARARPGPGVAEADPERNGRCARVVALPAFCAVALPAESCALLCGVPAPPGMSPGFRRPGVTLPREVPPLARPSRGRDGRGHAHRRADCAAAHALRIAARPESSRQVMSPGLQTVSCNQHRLFRGPDHPPPPPRPSAHTRRSAAADLPRRPAAHQNPQASSASLSRRTRADLPISRPMWRRPTTCAGSLRLPAACLLRCCSRQHACARAGTHLRVHTRALACTRVHTH